MKGTSSRQPRAAALALPAAPHAQQKVRINLANAFPNSLTLIGEAPGKLSEKLTRLSGGQIDLRVNEPGALVPALQAIQATGRARSTPPGRTRAFSPAPTRRSTCSPRYRSARASRSTSPGSTTAAACSFRARCSEARRLQHSVRHHPSGGLGLNCTARSVDSGRRPERA